MMGWRRITLLRDIDIQGVGSPLTSFQLHSAASPYVRFDGLLLPFTSHLSCRLLYCHISLFPLLIDY